MIKLIGRLILWPVIIIFTIWFSFGLTRTVCEKPLPYRLGDLDSRFNLTQAQAKQIIEQAEEIWEKPTGYQLFIFDDQADFPINFVFDSRQEQFLAQQQSQVGIESGKSKFDSLAAQYDAKVTVYNAKLERHNGQVAFYNSQGGAPAAEFEHLQKEQIELNREANDINRLASQLNNLAKQLNLNIDRFNAQIGEPFDAGEFNGKEINIYQFDDEKDLLIKLAHEMGHALIIEHVDDPRAIMYELLKDQDFNNPRASQTDLNALKAACQVRTNRLLWYRNINLLY